MDRQRECRVPAFAPRLDTFARCRLSAPRGSHSQWRARRLVAHNGAFGRRNLASRPLKALSGSDVRGISGRYRVLQNDARSGAIGMLPATIAKAVVTTEFPVFVGKPEKLDSSFVQRVLRTSGFLMALRSKATGTNGRKRITPEAFLDLRVPLPTLDAQRAIVATCNAAMAEAAAKERAADAAEAEGMADFEAALGFAPPVPLPDRPVFVALFKDFDRWSHEGVLRALLKASDPVPAFPLLPLGTIGKVSYGLQKFPGNRPGLHARPYLRVANVQRNRLDLGVIKTINVPDAEMPRYRLEIGDVLLCEGNSTDLVGRGAIWRGEIPDCVHQNHVLRVRLDPTKPHPNSFCR